MTLFYYLFDSDRDRFAAKINLRMQQVKLKNTSVLVSEICLGTMYFGTKIGQAKSESILNYYCEAGGNFIDTANNYAFWMDNGIGDESETVIGNWIKKNNNRKEIILATKCGARPTKYDGNLENIKLEGLSYKAIINAVEKSLDRLQTDYIDVLYAHIDFADYPIEERLKAFALLKEQGKVRYTGISNTEAWRIEESQIYSTQNGLPLYSCVQQRFTYLRPKRNADFWVQKLITPGLINYVKQKDNISLLAYSTLLSGAYTKRALALPEEYNTTDNRKRLKVAHALATSKNCSLNQLVLAWMMQQEVKIIPLISGSKVAQIQESLGATSIHLSSEEMKQMNLAGE